MYTLYGFFKYPPLFDNARDIVNALGELSDDSLTFARDKAVHSNGDYPQTVLVGFHSVMDNSAVEIPTGIIQRCLQIGQWLYDRSVAGQITSNVTQLLTNIQAEFGDQTIDISFGPLIVSNGNRLPTWIQYKDTKYDEENVIKVWMADNSFNNEYPEYHIEIIPPVADVDDLFLGENAIKDLLDDYDLQDRFNQVQIMRAQYPYTLHRVENYEWINPVDETRRITTPWIVVIYGRAGNNPDVIKNAIIEYILENSDRPRGDWEDLIPDLLLSTEFIVTPLWAQYAIHNLELEAGIHSPIIKPMEALALTKETVQGNGYTDEWIERSTEFSGLIYKSLVFTILGNPNNRTGITQFSEQFSDYILVTNNSADFNRMSVRTQEFKDMFAELIKLAETTSPTTQVPVGYSRLARNGIVYVAQHFEDILYLVVTRYSVNQVVASLGDD